MTEWSFRSVLAILVFSIVGAARSAEFTPPRLPDGLLDCILPGRGVLRGTSQDLGNPH